MNSFTGKRDRIEMLVETYEKLIFMLGACVEWHKSLKREQVLGFTYSTFLKHMYDSENKGMENYHISKGLPPFVPDPEIVAMSMKQAEAMARPFFYNLFGAATESQEQFDKLVAERVKGHQEKINLIVANVNTLKEILVFLDANNITEAVSVGITTFDSQGELEEFLEKENIEEGKTIFKGQLNDLGKRIETIDQTFPGNAVHQPSKMLH